MSKANLVGSVKSAPEMLFHTVLTPPDYRSSSAPFPTVQGHRGWLGYQFCVALLLATPSDFSAQHFMPCKHLTQFTALLLEPDLM